MIAYRVDCPTLAAIAAAGKIRDILEGVRLALLDLGVAKDVEPGVTTDARHAKELVEQAIGLLHPCREWLPYDDQLCDADPEGGRNDAKARIDPLIRQLTAEHEKHTSSPHATPV
jgi:hypothetical protein